MVGENVIKSDKVVDEILTIKIENDWASDNLSGRRILGEPGFGIMKF